MLLKLEGIMSVYNSEGVQVGNDDEKWDVYAQQAPHNDGVVYWAVDEEGTNVAKIQISSVYKWFSLLHHMEKDRSDRSIQCLRKEHENARLRAQSAVVMHEHRSLLPPSHCLALEQMKIIHLTESDRDGMHQDSAGTTGLACVHCLTTSGGFKYFPESMDALSLADEMIVNHVQSCPKCPLQIRQKLNTMQKASIYKEARSLRSTKTDSDKIHFFQQLWARLQSFERSSKMVSKSDNSESIAVRKDPPSAKKREFSEVDDDSTEHPSMADPKKRKESTPSVKASAFEVDNDLPEEEHLNRREFQSNEENPSRLYHHFSEVDDDSTEREDDRFHHVTETKRGEDPKRKATPSVKTRAFEMDNDLPEEEHMNRKELQGSLLVPAHDAIPKPMQLNEYPFLFDGAVWVCRHCQHLPPYCRGRNYIWPRNESPSQHFVDTHLRFCPGLCEQLGMQQVPNAFPMHWLCHE